MIIAADLDSTTGLQKFRNECAAAGACIEALDAMDAGIKRKKRLRETLDSFPGLLIKNPETGDDSRDWVMWVYAYVPCDDVVVAKLLDIAAQVHGEKFREFALVAVNRAV